MKFLSGLILLLIVPLSFVAAQSVPDNAGSVEDVTASGITLSVTPPTPAPDTQVIASLEATTIDLSVSTMSWTINGRQVAKGRGVTQISFAAGAVGTKDTVSVAIASPDGDFAKSLTLEIGSVDLLWEGSGYTPPFYAGRTLWAHQGTLIVTAIPHVAGNAANLIYRWSVDGDILADSSGVGRNAFSIGDSILGQARAISVDIMSDRDTILATGTLNLQSTDPLLRVYELNPLLGFLFNKEVDGSYALTDKEATFSAFPFFFDALDRSSASLSYDWSTGGSDQKTPTVTYRAPDGGAGSAPVTASVANTTQILQTAEKSFLVQFNNNAQQ